MASEQSGVVGGSFDDYYHQQRAAMSPDELAELNALEAHFSNVSQKLTERNRSRAKSDQVGRKNR